jgi:ABC-type transport system involved in cytochrome bd biosynthesis fused ATPase/permease subunit
MVVFYRGHTLLITNDVVEVWWPKYQRFSIKDLSELYVFRDVADPVVARGIGASAVMFVATAASWQFMQSMAVLLIGALVVLAPGVVGAACIRTRRRPWELRATYRGVDVQLFSSRDSLTFGQVKRALVRAMEANTDQNQPSR